MQLWLFVIGAVACVALSGATPAGGNEKPVVGKEPSHHHIRKRQLEAVNSLSGLLCTSGIPNLENLQENLNIPDYSFSGVQAYSIDVQTVDIRGCNLSSTGDIANPRIHVNLSNIHMKLTGRYKKKLFWFVTVRGSWELNINNAHLDVDATVQFDLSRGRVTKIDVNSCDDDFTDVSVRFHGSISAWIVNLFRGPTSRLISRRVEDKVCEVGTPYLENRLLQSYESANRPTTTNRPTLNSFVPRQ